MPDNVVRNGIAHTVVTSEITRNAINPRNEFIEIDATTLDDISDAFSRTSADSAAQQALTQPIIQDRYDTRTSLCVPKAHITTNLQKLTAEKLADNVQGIGSIESTHDHILYKEKKNIPKNVQHISDSLPVRASANLLSSVPNASPNPINLAAINLGQMSVDDMNILLEEAMNSANEDELKARIRRMKERLASANQTLKEIEDQDMNNSSVDPS